MNRQQPLQQLQIQRIRPLTESTAFKLKQGTPPAHPPYLTLNCEDQIGRTE